MDANPTPTVIPPAEPTWLRQNGRSLAVTVAALALVCYFLNPLDVLLAAGGLTLVIFLHELGHFAAAKACGVRVDAFAIGFGPALPFCSYKYGETTYKLGMVPLGGYVQMLGQVDGEVDDDADDDPRSFKNQTVPERMLIISAGVIMNLILGCILFVVVYMHGLEEQPAVIGGMDSSGAAWRQNVRSGTEVLRIDGRDKPWFNDIRPLVSSTRAGETVSLDLSHNGATATKEIEPIRPDGAAYPILGILAPDSLTLIAGRTDKATRLDTPAAAADFRPGDKIVGMTDPADPSRVTPLNTGGSETGDVFIFHRRMAALAGVPITIRVERADGSGTADLTVAPGFRKATGARMRMGAVIATRLGSPAEKAGVQPGDQITAVEIPTVSGTTVYAAAAPPEKSGQTFVPLDPLTLPIALNHWADHTPKTRTVRLTVLRDQDHTRKPVTVEVGWDAEGRYDLTPAFWTNSPVAVNGLGLSYAAEAVVEGVDGPAKAAGLQPGDAVTHVKYKSTDADGKVKTTPWQPVKPTQWAYVDFVLQQDAPFGVEVRVSRDGGPVELTLTAADDRAHATDDRGLILAAARRVMKAGGVGEALEMGFRRTTRSVHEMYLNLYSMIFGRVSLTTMSGPIRLAQMSYILAGESTWKLLLLLAIISINLAVVNFLPIPVLDGGHMMFLLYEGVRRKPAPESVQTVMTFAGLGAIMLLMAFVIGNDIWNLIRPLWDRLWNS